MAASDQSDRLVVWPFFGRVDARRMVPLLGLLGSDFAGFLGGFMAQLPILWFVLERYPDPIWIGVLALVVYVPLSIGALVSGLMVRRFGARRMLVISKGVALAATVVFAVLLTVDALTLPVLVPLAFVTYAALAPSMTADTSRIPALTRFARVRITRFNGVNQAVMVTVRLGGLALAGFLVEQFGVSTTFWVSSVLAGVALIITFATFPRDRVLTGVKVDVKAWWELTLRVGDELSSRVVALSMLALLTSLHTIKFALTQVVGPFVIREGGLAPTDLSLVFIASGVATALSALSYAYWTRFLALWGFSLVAGAILTASLVVIALFTSLWVLIAVMAVSSAAMTLAVLALYTSILRNLSSSSLAHGLGLIQAISLATSPVLLLGTGAALDVSPSGTLFALAGLVMAGVLIVAVWGRSAFIERRSVE